MGEGSECQPKRDLNSLSSTLIHKEERAQGIPNSQKSTEKKQYRLPMNSDKVQWYVMRAYQSERRAEEEMDKAGIENFLPKRCAVRVYQGKKSKRLVPVIPSTIFVHASFEDIFLFKRRHAFLQFVTWKKSDGLDYVVVQDRQMENFIKVASAYESEEVLFFTPDEISVEKGTRVRIHGGKLNNVEGVFMRVTGKRNRRLVVMLDGFLAASVEVHPDLIEVIK